MTRDYYNIVDITPNMKKSWTIEIQVVECGHRQLSNAKKEFRRLMFADTQVYQHYMRYIFNLYVDSNHVCYIRGQECRP